MISPKILQTMGAFFIVSACASQPHHDEIQLSPKTAGHFAQCLPSDGSMQLNVTSMENKKRIETSAEWLGETTDAYQLLLSDPLGQTLLSFEVEQNKSKLSGSAARKLPRINLDQEGYFQIQGNRLGLKATELPCIFNLTFPQEWQDSISDRWLEGDMEIVRVTMDQRQVTLRIPRGKDVEKRPVCANLKWWRYWGLVTREISWCVDLSKREGKMAVAKGWHVDWQLKDDD
jgi:hypothetical protein